MISCRKAATFYWRPVTKQLPPPYYHRHLFARFPTKVGVKEKRGAVTTRTGGPVCPCRDTRVAAIRLRMAGPPCPSSRWRSRRLSRSGPRREARATTETPSLLPGPTHPITAFPACAPAQWGHQILFILDTYPHGHFRFIFMLINTSLRPDTTTSTVLVIAPPTTDHTATTLSAAYKWTLYWSMKVTLSSRLPALEIRHKDRSLFTWTALNPVSYTDIEPFAVQLTLHNKKTDVVSWNQILKKFWYKHTCFFKETVHPKMEKILLILI